MGANCPNTQKGLNKRGHEEWKQSVEQEHWNIRTNTESFSKSTAIHNAEVAGVLQPVSYKISGIKDLKHFQKKVSKWALQEK